MEHYEKIALQCGNETVTYRKLIAETESRAAVVQKNGEYYLACGQTRLALAREILIGLAVGKVVVPISYEYGKDRADKIVEQLKEYKAEKDIVLMMFTSGSTGFPKGVQLTSENIISNLLGIEAYFEIGTDDTICIARSPQHLAVLVGEFLYGLIRGAKIVFYEGMFRPRELTLFAEDLGVSVLCGTPTQFRFFMRQGKPSSLKSCALSGECMPHDLPEKLVDSFPNVQFYHVYGLTECGPRVSALSPHDFLSHTCSVGKPLPQTQLKLVDGELWVRSPSVMQGYWNASEEADAILRDGWFHTGDMAHFDEDGYLYIDGRKDDMIIRCGMNIYPAEVERVAGEVNGVTECVVFGMPSSLGQDICLKYVGKITERELRKELTMLLPGYLLPSKLIQCDALERTASGKVIRR